MRYNAPDLSDRVISGGEAVVSGVVLDVKSRTAIDAPPNLAKGAKPNPWDLPEFRHAVGSCRDLGPESMNYLPSLRSFRDIRSEADDRVA